MALILIAKSKSNVSNIAYVRRDKLCDNTWVVFGSDVAVTVKETPRDIMELCRRTS